MRAIDFRLRPPYRSYLNNSVMYDYEALQKSHKMRDIGEVSPAAMEKSMELLIQEMNDAGIVYGVAPVRVPTDGDNDDAVRLMEEYPGRFLQKKLCSRLKNMLSTVLVRALLSSRRLKRHLKNGSLMMNVFSQFMRNVSRKKFLCS